MTHKHYMANTFYDIDAPNCAKSAKCNTATESPIDGLSGRRSHITIENIQAKKNGKQSSDIDI